MEPNRQNLMAYLCIDVTFFSVCFRAFIAPARMRHKTIDVQIAPISHCIPKHITNMYRITHSIVCVCRVHVFCMGIGHFIKCRANARTKNDIYHAASIRCINSKGLSIQFLSQSLSFVLQSLRSNQFSLYAYVLRTVCGRLERIDIMGWHDLNQFTNCIHIHNKHIV